MDNSSEKSSFIIDKKRISKNNFIQLLNLIIFRFIENE